MQQKNRALLRTGFIPYLGDQLNYYELRANLAKVLRNRQTYFVTDHGKPVKAMISYHVLLELLEVIEELKDKTLMKEVAQGRDEYQKGGWIPLSHIKKQIKSL